MSPALLGEKLERYLYAMQSPRWFGDMKLDKYGVSISVKSFSLFYSSPNLFLDRGILFLQNPRRVPNPIDQGKCLKNSSLTSPTLERVKDTNVSSSVDLVPKIDSKF